MFTVNGRQAKKQRTDLLKLKFPVAKRARDNFKFQSKTPHGFGLPYHVILRPYFLSLYDYQTIVLLIM